MDGSDDSSPLESTLSTDLNSILTGATNAAVSDINKTNGSAAPAGSTSTVTAGSLLSSGTLALLVTVAVIGLIVFKAR